MVSKEEASLNVASLKKRTNYDKRLILSIVESIESGKPRRLVIQEYGMSSSSLTRWLIVYGTASYHSSKPQVYTASEKRSVLRAISCGMSIAEARISFGVKYSQTIVSWLRKAAQEKADLSAEELTVMAKKEVNTDSEELRAMRKALEEAELKIKALDTLIDIAEEQLKINIRKKSGARQSAK